MRKACVPDGTLRIYHLVWKDGEQWSGTEKAWCPYAPTSPGGGRQTQCGDWCPLLDVDESVRLIRLHCGAGTSVFVIPAADEEDDE